jgi:hypothetical protein
MEEKPQRERERERERDRERETKRERRKRAYVQIVQLFHRVGGSQVNELN